MPRGLTPNQRALIKAKLKNPDATSEELSRQTPYSSAKTVREALASPIVKAKIAEMMDRKPRLRQDALLNRLEEGIYAKKDTPEDFPTSHTYLKTALQLRGDLQQAADDEDRPKTRILIINAIERARKKGICK